MSLSLSAKTQKGNLTTKIKEYCNEYSQKHTWKYETMAFWVSDDKVIGDVKYQWNNMSAVYDDIAFTVNILEQSSKKFDCDWQIYMPELIGEIRQGKSDIAILQMLETFKQFKDNQEQKNQRTQWNPEQKGKKPRTTDKKKYQIRWNAPKQSSDLQKEKLIAMPLTDKNLTDLRGIDINTGYQLLVLQNVDMSFGRLLGKMDISHSILDFAEIENLKVYSLQKSSLLATKINSIHLYTESKADFSFTNNDLSYSTISSISRDVRFDDGAPFIEHCVFDYATIKEIDISHFKNCSFKNVNFNKGKILRSVFENCDFTGASFDNVQYDRLQFKNCKGLDKNKMLQYVLVFCGEKISNENDIEIIKD